MDWIEESKRIFAIVKHEHFTDYTHCEECADHDATLRGTTVESITVEQLGTVGWDPLCFCSVEGIKYYMPALIKISLETIDTNEPYFEQFFFTLKIMVSKTSFYSDVQNHKESLLHHLLSTLLKAMIKK